MTTRQRTTLRWVLLALSVCSATGGLYLFTILRAGQGRYRDLIWPLAGLAVRGVLAAAIAGSVWAQPHDPHRKLRTAILCLAGSGLVAGSIFYGVLASCHLSQTVTLIAKKESPNGLFIAVQLRKRCVALVGYCPSVTQVRIIRRGEDPRNGGTSVFQFDEETDYLRFDWTSNTSMRITYPGGVGVMYRGHRAGNIDIQFLPMGTL